MPYPRPTKARFMRTKNPQQEGTIKKRVKLDGTTSFSIQEKQVAKHGHLPLIMKSEKAKNKLLHAIEMGLSYESIAAVVGVAFPTMRNWLDTAERAFNQFYEIAEPYFTEDNSLDIDKFQRNNEIPYDVGFWIKLHLDLKKAEIEGELRNLENIRACAAGKEVVEVVDRVVLRGEVEGAQIRYTSGTTPEHKGGNAPRLKRRFPGNGSGRGSGSGSTKPLHGSHIDIPIKIEKGQKVEVDRKVFHKKMTPNWNASAWLLERRFPEKYSRHKLEELPQNLDYETLLLAKALKLLPKAEIEQIKNAVKKSLSPKLESGETLNLIKSGNKYE